MIRIDLCNREEINQMNRHKWLESEKARYDLGQEAYFDWIRRYAVIFRKWANSLPCHCIGCGHCSGSEKECETPFNEHRLNFIQKRTFC